VIGTASGNLVDGNNVAGNTNGIFIAAGTRQTIIRQNVVLGNPGIQVANTRPDIQALDILNLSPSGQTTFERNVCVTSVNAPCPAIQRPAQ
jgi:parallel beta-helix repeat protein